MDFGEHKPERNLTAAPCSMQIASRQVVVSCLNLRVSYTPLRDLQQQGRATLLYIARDFTMLASNNSQQDAIRPSFDESKTYFPVFCLTEIPDEV